MLGLVKAVNTAVDLIVAHFGTSRDPDVKVGRPAIKISLKCTLFHSTLGLSKMDHFIATAVFQPLFASSFLPGQAGEQLGEPQRGPPHPEVPVPGSARGAAGRPEGLRAGPDHRPAAVSALEPGGGLHSAG